MPEFRSIIGEELVAEFSNSCNASEEKSSLKKCFTALMTCNTDKIKEKIEKLSSRLREMGTSWWYFLSVDHRASSSRKKDVILFVWSKISFSELAVRYLFTVHNSSCGKVMFLHLPVSHSVHRGEGVPATGSGECTPPCADTPPPGGHCSRRYAPYWNAFLFQLKTSSNVLLGI